MTFGSLILIPDLRAKLEFKLEKDLSFKSTFKKSKSLFEPSIITGCNNIEVMRRISQVTHKTVFILLEFFLSSSHGF